MRVRSSSWAFGQICAVRVRGELCVECDATARTARRHMRLPPELPPAPRGAAKRMAPKTVEYIHTVVSKQEPFETIRSGVTLSLPV